MWYHLHRYSWFYMIPYYYYYQYHRHPYLRPIHLKWSGFCMYMAYWNFYAQCYSCHCWTRPGISGGGTNGGVSVNAATSWSLFEAFRCSCTDNLAICSEVFDVLIARSCNSKILLHIVYSCTSPGWVRPTISFFFGLCVGGIDFLRSRLR